MRGGGGVREYGEACWAELLARCGGAAVWVGPGAEQGALWRDGAAALRTAGARAVRALCEPYAPGPPERGDRRKAVFVTECGRRDLDAVREIVRRGRFAHCVLVVTVGLDALYSELNENRDAAEPGGSGRVLGEATKQLEKMLSEWMDKKQSTVEVVHIPLFTISPTNQIFITPPYSELYPTFEGQLFSDTGSIDLYSLSSEDRSSVRRLASNLSSMLDSLNLREDIFYMGTFSSVLAGVLEYSPVSSARRKNCSNPASLILIDRTLDLCGVTSHSSESLLDKIMTVLPRFPGHTTDVAVDMSAVCEANVVSVTDDIQLSPGCLYHPENSCLQTLDYMVYKTQKEVMFDLYNKLSKMDVQRSPGPKTLLKVTPQGMEKIVVATKGNYEVIRSHLGLLQQALAVVQTLKSPQHAQLELMISLEKQVLQNISTSRDSTSVLNQISHLIKTRKERSLSLSRLLSLTVHVYSLAGTEITFTPSHEDNLRETLSVAMFEDHKQLLPEGDSGWIATPEECDELAKGVMKRLREVGQMRRILNKYTSVLKPTETGSSFEYKGLLQQLIEDLVDTRRPDLVDLKYRNDGIKDLLRSGLNLLTSKKARTKHPIDNPTVILFVVGGVTSEECRRIHQTVIASGTDAQVIVGSTRLVEPVEAMRQALGLKLG